MYKSIGSIELNNAAANEAVKFEITPICSQVHSKRRGFLIFEGKPFLSLSVNDGDIAERDVNNAQFAFNSLIANAGKYNALPVESGEQVVELTESLLEHADCDLYNMFGVPHFYVESKQSAPRPFRFNVWDRELLELLYQKVVKPSLTGLVPSDSMEYILEYA